MGVEQQPIINAIFRLRRLTLRLPLHSLISIVIHYPQTGKSQITRFGLSSDRRPFSANNATPRKSALRRRDRNDLCLQ